ncbi:uncharacterized protein TNIN_102301 [Trichonephila inaurata madagascariensis]|uniref:Uncharacterized protein n=1 Tax=Trichonephila inaurata madagascariensis TaxID=2747483 RepID=A0A8X6X2D1_9ARAC|nr:uncharacterized protein TNIN_102301 [Trichonephila inaurata madagascariensis]
MPFKLKDWLKAKLGFRRSSIPYEEFKDELGSTSDEVNMEPMITFDCAYCEYRSPTQKGLRCHRITVHRIEVGMSRGSFHARSKYAVWTLIIMNYSGLHNSHISIYLKNTYSSQRLFGPRVWSYQSLPEHHQVYLQRCSSVTVWPKNLVISVAA